MVFIFFFDLFYRKEVPHFYQNSLFVEFFKKHFLANVVRQKKIKKEYEIIQSVPRNNTIKQMW